ncbi:hypothetical protein D3C80_1230650 [compost metagenome]
MVPSLSRATSLALVDLWLSRIVIRNQHALACPDAGAALCLEFHEVRQELVRLLLVGSRLGLDFCLQAVQIHQVGQDFLPLRSQCFGNFRGGADNVGQGPGGHRAGDHQPDAGRSSEATDDVLEYGAAAIADVAGKAGIGIRDGHAARWRGGRREAGVGECRAGFAVRGFRGDLVVVGIDVVGHGSSVLSAQATRVTSAARACCGVDSW